MAKKKKKKKSDVITAEEIRRATPNHFHRDMTTRGGKIHKNKKKVIPRKQKYKEDY